MRHEEFREWLPLAVGDELSDEETVALGAHLDTCAECRAEIADLRRMKAVLQQTTSEPSERMLWSAREQLFDAVHGRRAPQREQFVSPADHDSTARVRATVGSGWNWLQGLQWLVPSAASVAAGLLIGWFAFGRTQPQAVMQDAQGWATTDHQLGPADVMNVRFVDRDAASGEIELRYDLVRPVRLRADVEDERMQRMLAYALLNEENDGVRLQAISAFDHVPHSAGEADVKRALIEAMTTDPNDGVRRQSLAVLQKFPFDTQVKEACLHVLANDDNPGMRVAAIDLLSQAARTGTVDRQELYDILKKDERDGAYFMHTSGALIEEENDVQ